MSSKFLAHYKVLGHSPNWHVISGETLEMSIMYRQLLKCFWKSHISNQSHISQGSMNLLAWGCFIAVWLHFFIVLFRNHSGYGLSQWEKPLQCNIVSRWLSPYPEWSVAFDIVPWSRHAMEMLSALLVLCEKNPPGPRLNIKTVLSTYGDFQDKTAVRTSYL